MVKNFFLKKSDLLKDKKKIIKIFENGKIIYIDFLKVIYIEKEFFKIKNTKICVLIPKKKIKKAVKRNKLKRRIINIYRINKNLLELNKKNFLIIFIWISKKNFNYKLIENTIKKIFNILIKK